MDRNYLGRSEHFWCHEPGTDVKSTVEPEHHVVDGFAMVSMNVVEGVYRPVHVPLISLNLRTVPAGGLWRSASATFVLDLYFSIRSLVHFKSHLQLLFSLSV